MAQFRSLPLYPLPPVTSYFEPSQESPAQVKDISPAILVMTDLRHQTTFTIEPGVSIDWALSRMKTVGVRLLFVVGVDKEVLGLITSTDIQGEKPMRLHKELGVRREEIVVRDIMTPRDELETLSIDDVLRASVGDVVATLCSVGRRHALVLDDEPRYGQPAIRGIFSASQIGKQLGYPVETPEIATTFAEVEMVLSG